MKKIELGAFNNFEDRVLAHHQVNGLDLVVIRYHDQIWCSMAVVCTAEH